MMSKRNLSGIVKRQASKEFPTPRDVRDLSDVLCAAAKHGDVCGVIDVFNAGAAANVPNRAGVLPMWAAVDSDSANTQVIRMLLSKGADVHIRNKKGETLLRVAGLRGRLDIVKILTDAGAGLMEPDDGDSSETEGESERSNYDVMYTVVRDLDGPVIQKKDPLNQC